MVFCAIENKGTPPANQEQQKRASELSSYRVTIAALTQLVGCRSVADCDNALKSFFSGISGIRTLQTVCNEN